MKTKSKTFNPLVEAGDTIVIDSEEFTVVKIHQNRRGVLARTEDSVLVNLPLIPILTKYG